MREWTLTSGQPLAMRFAADARLKRTDYTDDHTWEIVFGSSEEPAISFQTRYGGRANLARISPTWMVEGRSIHATMGLAERPILHAFTPSYARITCKLTNLLIVRIEFFVFESRAIGGRFTFENSSAEGVEVRLDLSAQIMREQKQLDMNMLGLEDGTDALHLGKIVNLNPVLMLENARSPQVSRFPGTPIAPKLISSISVPANGSASLKWTQAAQLSMKDSLETAYFWLTRADWDAELKRIEALADTVPYFETGDLDLDLALAYSTQVALRSFIGGTGALPYPSYVAARIPSRGYSPRGDGTDHGWQWNGQTAVLGYSALPTVAALSPELAVGAFKNFLAVRAEDGFIDFKPGLGGQRAKMLSIPLLASIALRLYEQTEDKSLVTEALPILRAFFERWFAADCDQDRDGYPEWMNTSQSAYTEHPIFARFRRWAINADIAKAESPDLAAYLIAEGRALIKLGEIIEDTSANESILARLTTLEAALATQYSEELDSYAYRDRDSNQAVKGVHVFRGKGDEAFDVKTQISPPNRLILRVVGGRDTAPRFSAVIEGINHQGQHVSETLPSSSFAWYFGLGAAVSEQVYSQVNYIKFEGLIRLFNLEVDTVDLLRHTLVQFTPLWAGVPTPEHAAQLVKTLTDETAYWRPYGLPICPANDPAFVANNDGGSGGVWMPWNLMLFEGLLRYGYQAEAKTLFDRLFAAQMTALRHDHAFREGYNSETGEGLGDIDELAGIVPISAYLQLIGLRIVSPRRVWAGGMFAFEKPVTVRRGPMEIRRQANGTTVKFPSGKVVEAGPDWQLIEDDTPLTEPEPTPADLVDTEIGMPVLTPTVDEEDTEELPRAQRPPQGNIPVQSLRDPTREIQISQIDFAAEADAAAQITLPTDPRAIKIKVRHANQPRKNEALPGAEAGE